MKKFRLVACLCGVIVGVGGAVVLGQDVAWRPVPGERAPQIQAASGRRTDTGYQFDGNVQVRLKGGETLSADAADVTTLPDGSRTVVLSGSVRLTIPGN